LRAGNVVIDLRRVEMRHAIDFDDELQRKADEIGEVRTDGMLTAKAQSANMLAPELLSKPIFRQCLRIAQRACAPEWMGLVRIVGGSRFRQLRSATWS
jgi:hypothetical protein